MGNSTKRIIGGTNLELSQKIKDLMFTRWFLESDTLSHLSNAFNPIYNVINSYLKLCFAFSQIFSDFESILSFPSVIFDKKDRGIVFIRGNWNKLHSNNGRLELVWSHFWLVSDLQLEKLNRGGIFVNVNSDLSACKTVSVNCITVPVTCCIQQWNNCTKVVLELHRVRISG